MTSENELREIAADEVREAVARYTALWENHPHLLEGEWERVADMIRTWPILDLPEPGFDNQGWAEWQTEYVTEVAFHPEDGLWSYDDGRMVRDTPDRLRKVALVYLAAADYAERIQK